jgi:hypothetical protein
MYMRPASVLLVTPTPVAAGGAPPRALPLLAGGLVAAVGANASFVAVEPLIHVAKQAAGALPF